MKTLEEYTNKEICTICNGMQIGESYNVWIIDEIWQGDSGITCSAGGRTSYWPRDQLYRISKEHRLALELKLDKYYTPEKPIYSVPRLDLIE